MPDFRLVSIHGAPRSGTSWLGKIFDSHPDVAYRFQPLFSYRFKGAIGADSPPEAVRRFLRQLYEVDDDEFILQRLQAGRGAHPPPFGKNPRPGVLAMKEVRYHYIIPALMKAVPDARIVGIVRHPCGVINSWLKTPREFDPRWDAMAEWRDAPSKNRGRREEYYGFSRWQELARDFLALQRRHPDRFRIVRYEALVADPEPETARLFAFCGLDMHPQTRAFLLASQQRDVNDPDSVFRTADVSGRWKRELAAPVREAILAELAGTDLEVFL